ncbi:molybdopterin-dependent oxidoreductase [Geopsychrobacter electrodiphilus]|uniref:molybdopterin-dependent oxidoreductase n=1 Tax=Geopsychrobacter electrodiphilus TaxID=225196 RepID=UPI000360C605|nr:molybdopterin-dependent oxidoreductase [Geopsychrobacter electrodiphilus]
MTAKLLPSVCPYDCPDCCGLLVEVKNDQVLRVTGDPDHPMTRGSLCAKMNHYEKTVHSERRLTTPLLRCGAKGAGQFRPISWDEAIASIATRWREIIATDGPEAILPYSYAGTMGVIQRNAGHPFFHRMGASQLVRGICTPAKGAGWEALMGETPAPDPTDVLHSDLVILWSSNAAATNIHFLQLVKQAKLKGARVWMIDLYRNQTAGLADRTLLLKPGTDAALALGLMHIWTRDGLCDQEFIAQQVLGFSELEAQILPAYSPAAVSRITGLSSAQIEELARVFAAARAPFISLGGGVSRYANGAMSVRCIVALPALIGAWGKPGGGCFVGTSTGAAFDMQQVERRDLLPERPPRSINMSQLGDALNKLTDPPLKSLFIYCSNPAVVAPDQNRVLEGLAREDLFCVVHERFLTDSARYADIVLPACSSLETSDIYRAYGSYTVQRTRPLIPPVGQSKSNLEVFALLAKAMGYEDAGFYQSAEEKIEQLSTNDWWRGVDMKSLAAGRPALLRPPPQGSGYATSSGKIEILNASIDEPLPRYLPPTTSGFPLQLVTAPALKTLNSTFFERDDLRDTEMQVKIHPGEAAERGLTSGERVTAFNALGEVDFLLLLDEGVPTGLAIAEGVWWCEFVRGSRTVNALTAQHLTDLGGGSTFYDNQIELRRAAGRPPHS